MHSNFTFSLWTGWDTDQFMTDIGEATLVMSSVVKNVSAMNQLCWLSTAWFADLSIFEEMQ